MITQTELEILKSDLIEKINSIENVVGKIEFLTEIILRFCKGAPNAHEPAKFIQKIFDEGEK